MLREANSAGLAKVRYSRIASDGDEAVNHGSARRRAGSQTHAGTRPSSAIASVTVEIPTIFIKFKISSRSVSPRTGSVMRNAFNFSARRYAAEGAETSS